MERAAILNQIINEIKVLREEGIQLFSREYIVPNAEYMIEEYFEGKLNPYLEKITKQLRNLPPDEYTIVALDTWLKNLQDQLNRIEESVIIDEFAEVLYIRQKFLPVLVDKIQDLKLELLEREFNVQDLEIKSKWKTTNLSDELSLSPEGISVIISLLYNQRIIKSGNIDAITALFSELTGYNKTEIQKQLEFDKSSARLKAGASLDELDRIVKFIQVMKVRVETMIAERRGR